ncbi:MAG: hypothetical protein H7A36_02935 [Chlamydiales bacterium]|nr:hypothetical protein [Chlamydiales bacterium]
MLRIALLLLLTGCTVAKTLPTPPTSPRVEHSLYVLHCDQGTIKGSDQLILHNVSRQTLYFSSLPIKNAGSTDITDFLEMWKGQEADAGFVFYKLSPQKFTDTPVSLSNPHYDGKDLTFDMKVLLDKEIQGDLSVQELTLFIDMPQKRAVL